MENLDEHYWNSDRKFIYKFQKKEKMSPFYAMKDYNVEISIWRPKPFQKEIARKFKWTPQNHNPFLIPNDAKICPYDQWTMFVNFEAVDLMSSFNYRRDFHDVSQLEILLNDKDLVSNDEL